MSNIIPSDMRGEFKIDATGKATISLRGAQRLLGLGESTLVMACGGAQENPTKLAGFLVSKGFDPAQFSRTGIPDVAFAQIAKYYAKSGRPQAELVYDAFAAIGVREWIHDELEWSISPEMKILEFMESVNKRMTKLEENQKLLAASVPQQFETANLQEFGVHQSIHDYMKDHNITLDEGEVISLGMMLSGYCKVNGMRPKKRWCSVAKRTRTVYPIMALAHQMTSFLAMKESK